MSGLVGFNMLQRENDHLMGRGYDIVIPGFYNVDNFLEQYADGDLTELRRSMALYSQATLDYKDWAFLQATARNDWSSTLPLDNNSYFYPSASLGIVFTDALGIRNKWLDYGKIRLSVAKVGSDAPPYRLSTTYYSDSYWNGFIEWPFNGTQGFLQGNSLGNPNLKPESTTEYEVGTELRMLEGRARLDLLLLRQAQLRPDLQRALHTVHRLQQHHPERRGPEEPGIGGHPQRRAHPAAEHALDLNFNWTKNKSTVEDLAPGVVSIYLAGYSNTNIQIREGEPYGVIYSQGFVGTTTARSSSTMTRRVPTTAGPSWTMSVSCWGTSRARWLGNMYTSFRYGPFTVSGLVSTVQGGDIMNLTLNYTIGRGVHNITDERGSTIVYPGVKESTGQTNDIQIVWDENYYQNERGGYLRSENYVEDGTATRLQEVSLQYQLPQSLLNRIGLGSAQLFLTGHNLHIWSDFSYGDPQGSNYGDRNAGGAAYHMFVAPSLRSYSAGLRVNW